MGLKTVPIRPEAVCCKTAEMSGSQIRRAAPQCSTTPVNILVIAGTDIPAHSIAGPYPSDVHIGLHTVDTQVAGSVLEVVYRDGRVMLPNDVTDQWLLHVQPARDRHEQNVEAYRDVKDRLCLRFLRKVNKGEQLLVWYGDDLARQSGIPVLTPDNIRGNQQYTCSHCKKTFLYPNSLKAHIRFRCNDKTFDVIDKVPVPSMFSVGSLLKKPLRDERTQNASMSSVGTFPSDQENSSSSRDSIQNWLLMRASAKNLSSSGLSAFTPTLRTQDEIKSEPKTPGSDVRSADNGVLNLSVRDGTSHQMPNTSMPGVAQPIQIFNHIHPPAFPIAIDHSAIRVYYPYVSPMHDQTTLCCGSLPNHTSFVEQRDACMSQYGRHLLMTTPSTRMRGKSITSPCIQNQLTNTLPCKNTPSSIPFPFPMPSETEGEPLDLIPRSLFTSKSRKGHLCIYCGKLYSRKYGLKIHMRTHTGYKPLKCKVCLRPFGDPSNLNKHVRLHAEGDTPYRCEFCGKVLVRRRDLERHVRSRHPDEVDKPVLGKDVRDGHVGQADTNTVVSADITDGEIVLT